MNDVLVNGPSGFLPSFDFGAWIRFGWQRDDAAIDYRDLYSGGINIVGSPWGRGVDFWRSCCGGMLTAAID